jgi:hypothetical protein
MRPNGVPNVALSSKLPVCLTQRAVAIRALGWRLRLEPGADQLASATRCSPAHRKALLDSRRYRGVPNRSPYVGAHARSRDVIRTGQRYCNP